MFALKNDVSSCEYEYEVTEDVADLPVEDTDVAEVKRYTFVVSLASNFTRGLDRRTYYYDLTLIDEHGEEVPLLAPQPFVVSGTVGASTAKRG